jgi:hypothetical protein
MAASVTEAAIYIPLERTPIILPPNNTTKMESVEKLFTLQLDYDILPIL